MQKAYSLAEKAYQLQEVPVGAVVVKDGKVIGEGYNLRQTGNNALAHAEIIAINQACQTLNSWRLDDCTIYVTLEPCAMCSGAIINSRIKTVVFACYDFKGGAFGGLVDLSTLAFNHKPEILSGIMDIECSMLLQRFFKERR